MSTSNTIKIQMLDEDWKDTNLAVDLWTKTHGVASTLGVSKEIHGAKKFDDYTREISFTPEGFHKFQRIMKKSEMPEVWFDENLDSYAKSQGLNIHSSKCSVSLDKIHSDESRTSAFNKRLDILAASFNLAHSLVSLLCDI